MSQSIRIAISGGGLAGASLMQALLQYPHLDVHLFESAPAFKEAGLAIGVTRNAQAALDLIGPPAPQLLKNAGAVPMKGVRFMIAQGEGEGEVINEVDNSSGKRLTSIIHRAAYLQQLLANVPEDHLHASKKLEGIDRNADGSITIKFADGTIHECDILIGADGIHSTVRKLVLGEDDPAAQPRNTGLWLVMTLQPFEKAQASMGKELIDAKDAREYSWVGQGSYILHNVLSDGQLAQFVISSVDEAATSSNEWRRTVSADEIRKLYANWPSRLRQAVEQLLCQEPEQTAIYLWEHPPARTYISGPLCVMGDAAHATTPWHGSGGGMSIEDSLILSTLLGRAKSPVEAQAALKAYDHVRRPRTQRIVESSRQTGMMLIGKGGQTGFEMKKAGNLLPRWDFILDIDMLEHRNEAIQKMLDELTSST
ncbi:salicylate hydroxylase [Xylaria flabelliformis]|nr:salicylate hydroxylase [Xylaria flabelliformis]